MDYRTQYALLGYREKHILQWAADRNLLGSDATDKGQAEKTLEEAQELYDAIVADNQSEVRDAIGDIYVTLVINAHRRGLTIEECVDAAWHEIKDRTGRMINGKFVKEADLPENTPRAT